MILACSADNDKTTQVEVFFTIESNLLTSMQKHPLQSVRAIAAVQILTADDGKTSWHHFLNFSEEPSRVKDQVSSLLAAHAIGLTPQCIGRCFTLYGWRLWQAVCSFNQINRVLLKNFLQ
jgi:hypothetical protein